MNRDQLRALQAPLKDQYRKQPESAIRVLSARGTLGDGVTCRVESAAGPIVAGLHPATGGDGSAVCSADLLLDALVACAGVTLSAVATALGITLERAELEAQGELDFRGTLGVSKDAPVGFKSIRLRFLLKTPASSAECQKLLELTERYCVVYQTLRGVAVASELVKDD